LPAPWLGFGFGVGLGLWLGFGFAVGDVVGDGEALGGWVGLSLGFPCEGSGDGDGVGAVVGGGEPLGPGPWLDPGPWLGRVSGGGVAGCGVTTSPSGRVGVGLTVTVGGASVLLGSAPTRAMIEVWSPLAVIEIQTVMPARWYAVQSPDVLMAV